MVSGDVSSKQGKKEYCLIIESAENIEVGEVARRRERYNDVL
jgi:hypothetical protein